MSRTMSRRPRPLIAVLALAALVASLFSASVPQQAEAVTGNQFNPGYIISDQYFYDANAMTVAQIQSFLNTKIGACSNSLCLNVLSTPTVSKPARYSSTGVLICQPYTGAASESAATIIFKVQQACGISAKVILVTLQKEQGLVTKKNPTAATLNRAMGYGCPDSANGACDAEYNGFFNQVYSGSWQLKRYGTSPYVGNYQPGWENIQYHPVAACGTTAVFVQNFATAALYNYTPYQPDGAALANLGGLGGACSSYGNRNFWTYYNDWFGSSTLPPGTPEGNLTITTSAAGVTVSGWVVDPDAVTTPVAVAAQLGTQWLAFTADQDGDDLSARFPGAGKKHYFSSLLPASAGSYNLCVYPVNAGGIGTTGLLGCTTVVVPPPPAAVGAIESVTVSGGVVSFSGWVVRPNVPTAAVPIAINVGSQWIGLTADKPNATAPTQVTGAGPNQGFSGSYTAPPGLSTFCLWASPTTGPAASVACKSILVPEPQKAAAVIETATATSSSITLTGWAVWPGVPAQSVNVALNIGSAWYGGSANAPSTTAATANPGIGPNHGYTFTVPSSPGTYSACVWVSETNGAATQIGCRNVTVAAAAPSTQAALDTVTPGPGSVSIKGWAVWTAEPTVTVNTAIQIDSTWYGLPADKPSTGAATAFPGVGPNHGFEATYPVSPGAHVLCVWTAQSNGVAKLVECRNFTATAAIATMGEVANVTGGVGGIHFDGWAVSPSAPTAPVNLAANVAGKWVAYSTGTPSTVAPTKLAGAGPNQGFSAIIDIAPGTYPICIWASSPAGAINLGCRTVTVAPTPAVAADFTTATGVAGGIQVSGWAVIPGSPGTVVNVAANIGSAWTGITANLAAPSAAPFVVGAGANQGFSTLIPAASGPRTVCIWVSAPGGAAVQVSCKNVTVP